MKFSPSTLSPQVWALSLLGNGDKGLFTLFCGESPLVMRRRILVIMIVQLWHVMVYGDYDDISLIKALLPEAYLAQVLLILAEHQVVLHLYTT